MMRWGNETLVIDGILGVEMSAGRQQQFNNEINTLIDIHVGLKVIYDIIKEYELGLNPNEFYCSRNGATVEVSLPDFLSHLKKSPLPAITPSYFHWFANSLCNYSRLVAYLVSIEKGYIKQEYVNEKTKLPDIRNACRSYTDQIQELADIFEWRNKISAHFALTSPKGNDSAATLMHSVATNFGYENGRIKTNLMIPNTNGKDPPIPSWSISETYEKLSKRFCW